MINGESTERVECTGYARVRNIDDSRVRGGVLLVIGEGLCLKAPKCMTYRGWSYWMGFAAEFANRSSGSEEVSYWTDGGKIWLVAILMKNLFKKPIN